MARRRFYKSELTVSCESNANRNRNYLGLAMSVLVLMLISSMIVAAIVIINPDIVNFSARSYGPREAITLDESINHELSANSFAFQWLASAGPGGEIRDEFLYEESKNLNIITMPPSGGQSNNETIKTTNRTDFAKTRFQPQSITTLVSNSSLLASVEYQGFKLSPSRRYLLIWTTKRRRFRHSYTAKYFVYDLTLDLILMLSTKPQLQPSEQAHEEQLAISFKHNTYESLDSATHYLNLVDDDNKYTRFQSVEWFESAEPNRADSLVMVQNNDIFLVANVAGDRVTVANNNDKLDRRVSPIRITHTGKFEEIFNGVPDWLYEEEILGPVSAFQVSPLANTLAYMSFNDSQVETMPYATYGSSDQVIPKIQRIKYPKTGRVNPRVSVHLVDNWLKAATQQPADIELGLPSDLATKQHYINRIKWLNNDNLALVWLNRHQNESYFVICSRQSSWACEKNLHLKSEGGWLDLADDLTPLDDEHYLALILKYEGPDVGWFKHIAKVSLKQSDTYTFLTSGRKEVLQIGGLDRLNSLVYYSSTLEDEPGQRQLFTAHLDSPPQDQPTAAAANCITCDHYPSECLYNYAKVSPSTNYYIFECEGPGVPRTELRTTKPAEEPLPVPLELKSIGDEAPGAGGLRNRNDIQSPLEDSKLSTMVKGSDLKNGVGPAPPPKDTSLLWVIESNQALRDRLTHNKAMPLTMRLKVPIANTNYSANVIMLLPPELGATSQFKNPSAAFLSQSARPLRARPRGGALPVGGGGGGGLDRPIHAHFTPDSIGEYTGQLPSGQQYPMVVDVYAGPNSQKVDYRFNINFGHYLASSRRTIYVMIDGRGSGNQGTKRLFEMYHRFGTVEIQDQIEVANYLKRNYSFIDQSKVAIWGWSYGGYAAAMALAQSNAQALRDLKQQITALQMTNSTLAAAEIHQQQHHKLAPDAGVFECAVSVAPVTNWIYYDTAYTERYMSSPYLNELYDELQSGDHNPLLNDLSRLTNISQQALPHITTGNKWVPLNQVTTNSQVRTTSVLSDLMMMRSSGSGGDSQSSSLDLNERYRRASLLEHIGDIDRKRFLLIHGTADDNVHFQQSVMLMKKLISKNIMFETRVYPDQDHGIANVADKRHLFSTLSNFFAECFDMAY